MFIKGGGKINTPDSSKVLQALLLLNPDRSQMGKAHIYCFASPGGGGVPKCLLAQMETPVFF